MNSASEANKAKAAKRVIEVLEFFDENHRQVTVMDIVRRYKRPQSSTSELLANLVDLGLLYKDARSRSYTLTPRAAILGSLAQPTLVRQGKLTTLIDGLVAHTGLSVALFGMVGLNAQIFRWTEGVAHLPTVAGALASGSQERLCDTPAGRLLLSTVQPDRRSGMIRRLNAEADEQHRFNTATMSQAIDECGRNGHCEGGSGFGSSGHMVAALLPRENGERPMALAFLFEPNPALDTDLLTDLLQKFGMRCTRELMTSVAAPPQAILAAA